MSARSATFVLAVFSLALLLGLLPVAFAAEVEWVKYSGNPIVTPTLGGWDADFTTTPRALFDGTMFRMWFVGGQFRSPLVLVMRTQQTESPGTSMRPQCCNRVPSVRGTVHSLVWDLSFGMGRAISCGTPEAVR